MVLNYFLPMVTLAGTYARISWELWVSRTIGEAVPMQAERIRSKRKVSGREYDLFCDRSCSAAIHNCFFSLVVSRFMGSAVFCLGLNKFRGVTELFLAFSQD